MPPSPITIPARRAVVGAASSRMRSTSRRLRRWGDRSSSSCAEAPEVDDLADVGVAGGGREVLGASPVARREVAVGQRVDQVVRDVDAVEGSGGGCPRRRCLRRRRAGTRGSRRVVGSSPRRRARRRRAAGRGAAPTNPVAAGHQDAHARKRTESPSLGPSLPRSRPGCAGDMYGRPAPRARVEDDGGRIPRLARAEPSVRPARAAVRAAEAGFGAVSSSDHLTPWSRAQGESGFAWSWLGAAMQATSVPFGVVNAPGPALPPGDHRPGHRHPGRDVPRTPDRGAGVGRGVERTRHRHPVAGQAGPQRPPARVHRGHPRPAAGRGGEPRRPRAGRPGPAVDPAVGSRAPDRCRPQRGDRPLVRRVGRRADHGAQAAG